MTIVREYLVTGTEQATSSAPLYFELTTDPDPVRVSPSSGDPQRADIVLVGSRRSGLGIECRKITITVPAGNNSPDLTSDINSIAPQISLKDWTPRTDAEAKTITFTPTTEFTVIGRDEGVTIQLMDARINTQVGSAPLRIEMEWREIGFDDPWETGLATMNIGKFPPDFVLDNFTAEQPIIDNGDSVRLSWVAQGASSVKLLYDVAEVDVTNKTTWTVPNVTGTTVFYLRGTVQVGNNTVERTLMTTVTVRIPDLVIGNLEIHGSVRMSRPQSVSLKQGIEAEPGHPMEDILDGSLDTYFLTKNRIFGGTLIIVDRGSRSLITSVDLWFGDRAGNFRPRMGRVAVSTDGKEWNALDAWSDNATEFHWKAAAGGSVIARYIGIESISNWAWDGVAIRSLEVDPPATPLILDDNAAEFSVPVIARSGITEP
ncbi:discoidin domain-containing protein [Nocardia sp. bgisy118]|uniref:discoidin domain-containing protein n=1 Tax=Nocardia sp. bgisy118 TaxID=3413786 RepID=UPI003F49CAF8